MSKVMEDCNLANFTNTGKYALSMLGVERGIVIGNEVLLHELQDYIWFSNSENQLH